MPPSATRLPVRRPIEPRFRPAPRFPVRDFNPGRGHYNEHPGLGLTVEEAYDYPGMVHIGRGVRVNRAAEAGGNFPALGYVGPGVLTQPQAFYYNSLLNQGVTPEQALSQARYSSVGRQLGQLDWGQFLERMYSGAATGAALAIAFTGGPEDPVSWPAAALGYALGGIAGIVSSIFGGPSSPPKTGRGEPPMPRKQPTWEQFVQEAQGLASAAQSMPSLFNGAGPGAQPLNPPPMAPPTPQPYYVNPSTEVIPPVTPPAPQPYPPMYQVDYPSPNRQPDNFPSQPLEIDNQPDGGRGGRPLEIQPRQTPQNVPIMGRQDCPMCEQLDDLDNRLRDQIQIEQQQDLDNTQPEDIAQEIPQIADQIQHFKQLETQPASQRDIPSELQQKQNLRNRLKQLKDKARKVVNRIRFCVECDDEQDALLFFNGEGDGASCRVTSQQGASQPMLQTMTQADYPSIPGYTPPPVPTRAPIYSGGARGAYDDYSAWSSGLSEDLKVVSIQGFRDGESGNPMAVPQCSEDPETCAEIYNQAYSYGAGAR